MRKIFILFLLFLLYFPVLAQTGESAIRSEEGGKDGVTGRVGTIKIVLKENGTTSLRQRLTANSILKITNR